MRHLAIFLPSLDGGGAEKVILALAERFVARNIKCDLVIAIKKGKLIDEIPKGVRLICLNKYKTSASILSLARYIRREQPDTILSAVFAANLCAILSAKMACKGTRVVTSEVSPPAIDVIASNAWTTIANKIAARILYPLADNIISVSNSIKSGILESKLTRPSRVKVIYNPIIDRNCLPSNTQYTPEKIIIACGRLEAQKDYPTLLRAFRLVRNKREAKLQILGEGSLRSELEIITDDLGLSEDVTFTGYVPYPPEYMRAASVFVHTATYEGFGVVLLEALTARCPIVATDSPGGIREVLANGKFGTLVPIGNEEMIAKAIIDILDGKKTFPDPTDHLKQFNIDQISESYIGILFPNT